jgi:hypothetical protein
MILEAVAGRGRDRRQSAISRPASAFYSGTMMAILQERRRGCGVERTGLAVLLSASLASCFSSSAPTGPPDSYRGQYDPRTHRFVLQHTTTPVRSAGIDLAPGAAWTDSAGHVHVGVSLRNARTAPRFMPRGVQVDDFTAASVWPLNAGCARPIPNDLAPMCVFWHFDSYGTDHRLDPGESSTPVEWIFDDPGDLPFEFTAWLWWPHG